MVHDAPLLLLQILYADGGRMALNYVMPPPEGS